MRFKLLNFNSLPKIPFQIPEENVLFVASGDTFVLPLTKSLTWVVGCVVMVKQNCYHRLDIQ